jgi:hypothetical protein
MLRRDAIKNGGINTFVSMTAIQNSVMLNFFDELRRKATR